MLSVIDSKIGPRSGLWGIVVFVVFTAMAIIAYPGYSFAGQYLSELGTVENSAFWFNAGLILSGILLAAFFASLRHFLNTKLSKAAIVMGVLASASMAGVGLFSLRDPVLHDLFAKAFFFWGTGVMVLMSCALAQNPKFPRRLVHIGFALSVVKLATLLLGYAPILQKLDIAVYGIWILLLSNFIQKQFAK